MIIDSVHDRIPLDSDDLTGEVRQIFSESGLLSRAKNFEYRPQQQEMAVRVARALTNGRNLALEAGTGVGKSLGYLIPAILYATRNSKKAVVSTHTINLQEQLVEKDLPMLEGALPVDFKFTMLKGRQNYLCGRRLLRALRQADGLFTSPEYAELKRIHEWAKTTEDGSLSDFEFEPDPKVWSMVCSERGLCSPKQCGPNAEGAARQVPCFYQRARARILGADVLVLNHTLFFSCLGGYEEPVENGALFRNDFVIFDEAHTIENVASRHTGLSYSVAQARFLLNRLWNPRTGKGLLRAVSASRIRDEVEDLSERIESFFLSVEEACDHIHRASHDNKSQYAPPHSREWKEIRIRRPDMVEDTVTLSAQRLRELIRELVESLDDKYMGDELREMSRRLLELRETIRVFLNQEDPGMVYWVTRSGVRQRTITLNSAPLNVGDYLERTLFRSETSVIMTSATLALKNDATESRTAPAELTYFQRRVGAWNAETAQLGSPFDYSRQMEVFVAGKMPDPRTSGYEAALAFWIERFIKQSDGRAFVLFTNLSLMSAVADRLAPKLRDLHITAHIQGRGTPRSALLEAFKTDTSSVLFGVESFWQGVDVPGESLSNVIITRLPFAVPDHPLTEAKVEAIEARGGNAFMEHSLPEALIKFRQGVGRLIRTHSDTGIVAILDNRILTKRYGKLFFDALPEARVEVV